MSRHKWLLRFYPRAWRARYEDEFLALLEQWPLAPGDYWDALRGAVDAHLHPQARAWRVNPMTSPLRRSIITVFCAYIGFIVAGVALYGMVDDSPFIPLMRSHLLLALAWYAIAGGSVVALGAVVIGGLPLGAAALRHAWRTNRRELWLFGVPPLALVALMGGAVLLAGGVILAYGGVASAPAGVAAAFTLALGLLFVLAAGASTAAVCLAVAHVPDEDQIFQAPGITIRVQPYHFAFLPAVITTLAMGLMLVSTLGWGLLAALAAPQAFSREPGLLGLPNAVTFAGIITLMTLATVVAAAALWGRRLVRRTA